MKELLDKMKQKGSKRIIENAVIFIVLLIIIIIVINSLNIKEDNVVVPTIVTTDTGKTETLEEKLEGILSMIEGAGKVKVLISYLSSEEKVPIYDISENKTITEEKDKEGGTRKTESNNTDKNIIYEEIGNNKQPFIKQVEVPKAIGVIVVADGANNVKVKENIISAVVAAVDVPQHRIQVFSRQR